MLQAIVAWTAFAFGGVYPSTLAVPAILLIILGIAYRPAVVRASPTRHLDLALLVALACACVQVLPLPRALVGWIAPDVNRVAAILRLADPGGALPLSIDLPNSTAATLLFGATLLTFFTARQLYDAGGVRTVARGIAVAGLVLAAVGIAQDATGQGQMYWRWRPIQQRADPFGPFVNRNHFGTWAIMAIMLTIGYLTAHASAHRAWLGHGPWRQRLVALLDFRAALLLSAAAMMILATVLSLSRSAMLGLATALALGAWLASRRDITPGGARFRPAAVIVILAIVAVSLIVIRVDPSSISQRISNAPTGMNDRALIWHETVPILRDFWLTGTGLGTYQTSMAVYQRSNPGLIYNQAHNHYLQVAAEGGLLVGLPIALAMLALCRDGAAALRRDRSGMYWLRAGAASGLAGVAVQSLFETGLTTPANAVLAAVLAATLLHAPGRYGPPRMR